MRHIFCNRRPEIDSGPMTAMPGLYGFQIKFGMTMVVYGMVGAASGMVR